MTNLTDLQFRVLEEYAGCEMNGANGGIEWLLSDGSHEETWTYLWADEHAPNLGITEQQLGGVLTSLLNAGLISMLRPGRGPGCSGDRDGSFKMTEAGFQAWKERRLAQAEAEKAGFKAQAQKLTDFTDAQLASALHFLEGHETSLEGEELEQWMQVKATILHAADTAREMGQ